MKRNVDKGHCTSYTMKVNMKNETNSSDDTSDSDVEYAPSISSKTSNEGNNKENVSNSAVYQTCDSF